MMYGYHVLYHVSCTVWCTVYHVLYHVSCTSTVIEDDNETAHITDWTGELLLVLIVGSRLTINTTATNHVLFPSLRRRIGITCFFVGHLSCCVLYSTSHGTTVCMYVCIIITYICMVITYT